MGWETKGVCDRTTHTRKDKQDRTRKGRDKGQERTGQDSRTRDAHDNQARAPHLATCHVQKLTCGQWVNNETREVGGATWCEMSGDLKFSSQF